MLNKISKFISELQHIYQTVEIVGKPKYFPVFLYMLFTAIGVTNRIIPGIKNHFNKVRRPLFTSEFVIKNEIGTFHATTANDSFMKSMPFFEEYSQLWLDKAKNKEIFVDIGANIGFFTLLALNKKGYQSALVFEPTPETFQRLRKNIRSNNLGSRVKLYNKAVGSERSVLQLAQDDFHTGGNQVVADKKENTTEVEVIPFTAALQEHSRVKSSDIGFLKIDVEGFELEVLKGMKGVLQKLQPETLIFIEIREIDNNRQKVELLLNENGFRVIDSQGSNYLYEKQADPNPE